MPHRRGPAPKPELTLLRPKGVTTASRTPVPASRPANPPSWLNASQRRIWTHTVTELAAAGLDVHAIDQDILTAYVTATDQMTEAAKLIATEGVVITGSRKNKVRHPATIVFAQSARLVDRLAASLGLAPDSRMRMRLPAPDTEAANMADPYSA